MKKHTSKDLVRFVTEQGPLVMLAILCLFFSVATVSKQAETGKAAAIDLSESVVAAVDTPASVLLLEQEGEEEAAFREAMVESLEENGFTILRVVQGGPPILRAELEAAEASTKPDVIVGSGRVAMLPFIENFETEFPALADTELFVPDSGYRSNFLKTRNLVNLLNQIAIYAILAIGMTLVIITGGIDLSVGSLVGFAAVVCAVIVREFMGGEDAGVGGLLVGCVVAILSCGVAGLFSGAMVTFFRVPPFIVTLSMMLVASGLAYILAGGGTIQMPDTFILFASGKLIPGVPNAVLLAAVLYVVAHILMTRTVLGRYIYAVGGNAEAARLSGVPVRKILLLVYALCGLLAGLGGVVYASQFTSASAKFGEQYELTVIAAVVVGGTSLFGGEGKILGTLVGSLLLAVIFNGMNLIGMGSYWQKVALGLVILSAALLDMWKKR
jgi:ribose transport system permease protein